MENVWTKRIEQLEKEAKAERQLVGIRIILVLSIIYYTSFCFSIFSTRDVGPIVAAIIFFGGFIVLSSIGLKSLNHRKNYAIPLNRANLILFSFWIGFISNGLILLIIFWRRFKNPLVKKYLNYGKTRKEEKEEDEKK